MKRVMCILVTLLQIFILFNCSAYAFKKSTKSKKYDWPQWRGINRDAVSLETGLLHEWPKNGPQILWRKEAGAGYSSVSIVDSKLYTMWDEGNTQFLFCLEASTGKELWRQELGPRFKHPYGNGPRSSPLIDGQAVFVISAFGHLLAANKNTGKLLWQHNLERDYGAIIPPYGYSSSPLIEGEKLLVEVGAKDAAFIAFNKKNGQVVWTSQKDLPAYSSPISISVGGVKQIVFWSAHGLHAISPDVGKILWKCAWETFCPVTGDPLNTGTPIFLAPDKIFISSGSGAAVLQMVVDGERLKVKTVWKSQNMRSDVNTSVLLDNHIYGFDMGVFKCLDAATGEVKWQTRGFGKGSLIAADGQLIVLSERGKLALVEATPDKFVEKDHARILSGKCWTTPTLAGGKLYLRNHKELVCLNMESD